MSKYSEKHPRETVCQVPECQEVASVLRMVQGRPGWYCERHRQAS